MSDMNKREKAVKLMVDAQQRYSDILSREMNPIDLVTLPAMIAALEGMAEALRKMVPEAGEAADDLNAMTTRNVRTVNLSHLTEEEADKFMEEFRNELR